MKIIYIYLFLIVSEIHAFIQTDDGYNVSAVDADQKYIK